MTRAYVGLGSNIDPEANVRAAVHLLAQRTPVVGISTFYRTASIPEGRPPFINGVVAIKSSLDPWALKYGVLRQIEAALGRQRGDDKDAPRTIDCDLLLYGATVRRRGDLVLPAPDIVERAFIAVPLLELAPDLVLPGSDLRLADVAASLPRDGMLALPSYRASLYAELKEVSDELCAR